jgi:hypothetical protein
MFHANIHLPPVVNLDAADLLRYQWHLFQNLDTFPHAQKNAYSGLKCTALLDKKLWAFWWGVRLR